MTKTFTAKQLHHAPAQVFRAADKGETTIIRHNHYKDILFQLIVIDKKEKDDE
jgi:hypothetical protein